MSTLLFDLHGSFHFQDVRVALIRIPEVIQKIREVQVFLDKKSIQLDLGNFLAADDSAFLHHYRRKEFAGVVLQLGLFDRYLKFNPVPASVVGVVNSISAVRVISGQINLEQLVEESFRVPKSKESAELPGLPILTGIQIPKYQRYVQKEKSYEPDSCEKSDLAFVLDQLEPETVLEVGLSSSQHQGTIERDPHLGWVWDQVRGSLKAFAI